MNLPTLGDSISEGTIVKWEKAVGDLVEVGDVVAVIETDKVSVDIRSEHRGIMATRHAAVDDRVEVGKPICTLDLAGAPDVVIHPKPAPTPPPKASDSAGLAAYMSGAVFKEEPHGHEPLIKFLGKRRPAEKGATGPEPKKPDARSVTSDPATLEFFQILGGAMAGRPGFTQDEIDAIESGGAVNAPSGKVKGMWVSS